MSQIASGHAHAHNGDAHAHGHHGPALNLNDSAVRGGLGKLAPALWFVGVVGLVVAMLGANTTEGGKGHALAAYHVGFLFSLGLALGCLGLTMILQQFNAGWSAAIRRQAENVASLIPVVLLLFLPVVLLEVFVFHGKLFHWMHEGVVEMDPVLRKKAGYLNVGRWLAFAAIYFTLWTFLATKLRGYSTLQDTTGDKWLTAKARRMSSYGLLLFALSTAFASFDWLMTMDPHWFSTMFGVYFFAGGMMSCIALIIVILGLLRMQGKLEGVVTAEHFHDLGKLLFAFTVFWAYVTFCQYFLIWYSNIPEETSFYNLRAHGGYEKLGIILCFGHFIIPFVILLFRGVKRNYKLLMLVALWQLAMHAVDLLYMVRPIVHDTHFGEHIWLDILGLLGPLCIFLGFVAWRVGTAPLVPLKDPRLHEALAHKNYV